jgi:hypothetical protein
VGCDLSAESFLCFNLLFLVDLLLFYYTEGIHFFVATPMTWHKLFIAPETQSFQSSLLKLLIPNEFGRFTGIWVYIVVGVGCPLN